MDFLQHINPTTAILLGVGLCALCLVLPLLLSGLHVITAILSLFTHAIGALTHLVSGGPVAWCGCLVAIGVFGFVVMMVWLLSNAPASCAVHPTNFCGLLGYAR